MRKLTLLRTAETERRKPEAKNADGTEPKDRTGKGKLEAARGKMEWAEELLDQERPLRLNQLQRIYSELLGVKEEAPEPFAGDAAYLWERLAFAFNYYGQLKQAERCLRIQAELQPDQSDAFLNLGVFLTDAGYYDAAIAACREGLKRTPNCEFLNYNLAGLASLLGRQDLVQSALNEALVANPSRGLNQLAKGNLCLERNEYEVAVQYFQEALAWAVEEELPGQQLECLQGLGVAYLNLEELDKARAVLEQAVDLDPSCSASHELLAYCHKRLGNEWLYRHHLKQARDLARYF